MEKSPSPVYGARLELVYGLIAHRGFESLLLRQESHRNSIELRWLFHAECVILNLKTELGGVDLYTTKSGRPISYYGIEYAGSIQRATGKE